MKWFDYYLQKRRFEAAGRHILTGSTLLDIGCNRGEFFLFLKKKTIKGTGIDPEASATTLHLPDGVSLISDHFPSEKLNDKKFDYITALAVFEHIPDENQKDFLESCQNYLSENGKIIITVPSPLVDHIILLLRFLKIVHAMSIEQHHGLNPKQVVPLFVKSGFTVLLHKKFELGLNNLFVFGKNTQTSQES